MFVFIWPWTFLFLPLPLLVWLFLSAAKRTSKSALRVPAIRDFESELELRHVNGISLPLLFFAIIVWVLLVIAGARPQWQGKVSDLPVSGRDLMLAVDLSGSMRHHDFRINFQRVDRLTAAKWVVSRFVTRRKGDRIGLIVFGTQAFLHVPLTFDTKTVISLLNESFVGMAGDSTAIGDAIGLAVKRLRNNKTGKRVLILLTDGKNTGGSLPPKKAADLAKQFKLTIYTIGVGSPFASSIDEEGLRAIAKKTNGRYFRAQNLRQLNEIYSYIDKLEPTEKMANQFRPRVALYHWILALVLVMISARVLFMFWRDSKE